MTSYTISKPFILIVGIFMAHLLSFTLPSVNLEFAFVDAARYFNSKDISLLDQYFRFQANTLGIPYLGHLTSLILPNLSGLVALRLLSTLGVVLLGLSIINICNFLNRKDIVSLLLLILLNPLIWIYSGRATADFLPSALGIFSISLIISKDKSTAKILFASILMGIAAILKYHSILLILILICFLYDYKIKRFEWKIFSIFSSISILILLFYIILVHKYFGFWITPPAYLKIHQINISGIINNYFLYLGYLVILCAPPSLALPRWRYFLSKNKYWIIGGGILLFTCGFLGFHDSGELNLGPLNAFINQKILAGLALLLSSFFFTSFFIKSKGEIRTFNRSAIIAIGLVILILSLTRPAQRYLLFVIPFYILLLPKSVISSKTVINCSLGLYLLANIYVGYSQWCTGTSANRIVEKIRQANLLSVTDPGDIVVHVGNQFNTANDNNFAYTVVSGYIPGARIYSQSGILFLKKSFSLVEVKWQPNKN